MHSLAPYLLFSLILLSSLGPARAAERGEVAVDAAHRVAVASMAMPSLERKLKLRAALGRPTDPGQGAPVPASFAAVEIPAR
jgi:hypothetical protein